MVFSFVILSSMHTLPLLFLGGRPAPGPLSAAARPNARRHAALLLQLSKVRNTYRAPRRDLP